MENQCFLNHKKKKRELAGFFSMIFFPFILFGCVTAPVASVANYNHLLVFGYESNNYHINLKTYSDPDKDWSLCKTYSFDYTSKENPLLEKELFNSVEDILAQKGLKRVKDNPDILITMDFYIGKRENYIPPQTITTTQVQQVWSTGHVGWAVAGGYTPIAVTESQITPGRTETVYYRNIRLNFLDYQKLKRKSEIPPLVWMGEVDSEGAFSDIRLVADVMLGELLGFFPPQPNVSTNVQRNFNLKKYGSIGVKGFSCNSGTISHHCFPLPDSSFICPTDSFEIVEIEPGSPAEAAGLLKGDIIRKINRNIMYAVPLLPYNAFSPYGAATAESGYCLRTEEVQLEVERSGLKAARTVRITPKVIKIRE